MITTPPSPMLLSPELLQIIVATLSTLIPAFGAYLVWILKQRQNIEQSAADATLIDRAAGRAAGIAYTVRNEHPETPRSSAVALGVAHLTSSVPDAMGRLDVKSDAMTRMVTGELGKLEAAKPLHVVLPPTNGNGNGNGTSNMANAKVIT